MSRIIEFEGRRIEVPDDATDQEIRQILSAQPTQEAAPTMAAPAEEPGWLESVLNGVGGVLDQGARGVAEGAVRVATLPQTLGALANTAADAFLPETMATAVRATNPLAVLPSSDRMLQAGDQVNESFANLIGAEAPPTQPSNVPEAFAGRIGQEIGAMMLPVAGIVSRATQIGPQAAREGGRLSRMFLEPAAVNTGRFIRNETALATGAGTGAAVANQIVDPDTTAGQIADVGGALLGAGGTAAAAGLLRSGNEVLGALLNRPNYVDDVVKEAVVDRIAEASGIQTAIGQAPDTSELANIIETGPRIADTVPGVKESLADRTRNPGLASLEYSRQTGLNSGMFARRRNENSDALNDVMAALEPQGSPAALREELDLERNRRLMDAGVQEFNAADAARRAVEPLAPQGTPAARGATIRSALSDAREAARARTEAAYGQADIAGQDIRAEDLIGTIEGVVTTMTQAEQSRLPEGLIGRIRSLGENPATLKEATDLRSELLELRRAAQAAPGGRNEARVLSRLEEAVDDFITSNVSTDQRDALDAARATRFAEAEAFDRAGDPVQRALSTYEGGRPRMADENVARTFTNTQNMDRLLAQADTPEVRAAIRNEMLSGLDTSRADRMRDFLTTNAEQIDRFPGLRAELETAARARADEAAATTARSDMERSLGTQDRRGTSTVGRYLSYSDAQSERAMREVMSARDPAAAADELLTFVGDSPQAVAGAQKSFWNTMAKQSRRAGETTAAVDGQQPWMPRALIRFLDEPANRAVAERFYRDNPEHIENVRIIAEALKGLDVRNAGKVPNTSGTAQGVLPSFETVGSRVFAYQRGQVGAGWLITNLAAIAGRRAVKNARGEAIERMLDDALLNPDVAAMLLRENNPANRAALRRRAKVWFGNEANTIMNALSGEEQDDETMEAIRGR